MSNYTESILNKQHRAYKQAGLAHIWKNDPGVRVTGQNTALIVRGVVDYTGVVKNRGMIAMEVKESKASSFPTKNIAVHQLLFLHEIAKFGGTPYLFINMRKYDERFVILITDESVEYITNNKSLSIDYLRDKPSVEGYNHLSAIFSGIIF